MFIWAVGLAAYRTLCLGAQLGGSSHRANRTLFAGSLSGRYGITDFSLGNLLECAGRALTALEAKPKMDE
jgi:hypothetical protein